MCHWHLVAGHDFTGTRAPFRFPSTSSSSRALSPSRRSSDERHTGQSRQQPRGRGQRAQQQKSNHQTRTKNVCHGLFFLTSDFVLLPSCSETFHKPSKLLCGSPATVGVRSAPSLPILDGRSRGRRRSAGRSIPGDHSGRRAGVRMFVAEPRLTPQAPTNQPPAAIPANGDS